MSSVGSSPGSAGAQHQAPNSFQRLVENLQDILGPTSGINSEDVDTEQLQQVMRDYKSRESDWGHFALADSSTNYTRNLVDKGNGKSNLLILVWNPAKGSPIHDHANAHCIMKVLKGSLKETRYGWPDRGNLEPPKLVQEQVFGADEVTYMSDTLGLHTISNPDARNIAVSLHLYTPPNAANYGFNIYDRETGKPTSIKQGQYYSEFGKRTKDHVVL